MIIIRNQKVVENDNYLRHRNRRVLKTVRKRLREKEKRKAAFFEQALKGNPMLSHHHREHIKKYGKPRFMLNAKSILQQQEYKRLGDKN
jgi:hypothetical protein